MTVTAAVCVLTAEPRRLLVARAPDMYVTHGSDMALLLPSLRALHAARRFVATASASSPRWRPHPAVGKVCGQVPSPLPPSEEVAKLVADLDAACATAVAQRGQAGRRARMRRQGAPWVEADRPHQGCVCVCMCGLLFRDSAHPHRPLALAVRTGLGTIGRR